MRPAVIEIPGVSFARMAAQAARAGRFMARFDAGAPIGIMFANHEQSEYDKPALRGLACTYSTVFEIEGRLHALMPGCFTDSLRDDVADIQIDHIKGTVVGDTRSGLRFVDTGDGLAFEFLVPKGEAGSAMASMVACDGRTDISVGVDAIASEVKNIRGHDVQLVTKAKLREISICRSGAVKEASVRICDAAGPNTLEDDIAYGTLAFVARVNEISTRAKEILATAEAHVAVHTHRNEPGDHREWAKIVHVRHNPRYGT